jgi:hypothetical protein
LALWLKGLALSLTYPAAYRPTARLQKSS